MARKRQRWRSIGSALARRVGGIAAIADDPRGAILADLDRPLAGIIDGGLPTSSEAARAVFDFQAEQAAKQKLAQRAKKLAEADNVASQFNCKQPETAAPCVAPSSQNDAANQQPQPAQPQQPPLPQQLFLDEAKARVDAAIGANIGLCRTAGLVLVQSLLRFG